MEEPHAPVPRAGGCFNLGIRCWPTAARADDPAGHATGDLPEAVVTATRVPTPIDEIPAGVTVIDRATIEAHGYNSLTQALADVPGVHVSPSGGQGGQASVFIRGTNSNHVLVLRDGMPITDASDPTGAFNFGIDTLSDIERIEIIRGPMAALYGSGAIGGVINLISRRGTRTGVHWQRRPGRRLSGADPRQLSAPAASRGRWIIALTAEGAVAARL